MESDEEAVRLDMKTDGAVVEKQAFTSISWLGRRGQQWG
jgi:hypothetical protein